jgi:hypothetical protein
MIDDRLSDGFLSAICVGSNISDGASMAPNRSKQNSNDKRVFCEQSRSAIEAPSRYLRGLRGIDAARPEPASRQGRAEN